MTDIIVTDTAIVDYLVRVHKLDAEAVRSHLAGLAANGARLGACGVIVEGVKLILEERQDCTAVTGVRRPTFPTRRAG
jgi:hypothetical protein